MKPCSVCIHPDLEEIDRSLGLGHPVLRVLAKEKALSKTALLRHKAAHLGQRPAASDAASGTASDAVSRDPGGDDDSHALIRQIRSICSDARRLAAKAERKGDLRAAILAINSRAASLEKLMRALLDQERQSRPVADSLFASAWRTASAMSATSLALALAARGQDGRDAVARLGGATALAELDALPPAETTGRAQ